VRDIGHLIPLASVWSALADPWAEPIMRRAFAEMLLLGLAGGALGCWVLFYDLAYSAESLAHALLPGLVAATLLGLPLLLGGAVGVLVAALAVALAGRTPAIGRDTAVAVVVTALFGLGVLLALSPSTPRNLQGLLFGDILGANDTDLALAAALAALVAAALVVLHPRLLTVGFDRTAARALGVPALAVDAALLVLVAVTLVVAVQGLGNLLVVAVLVAPAASARLLTRRMGAMALTAAAIAVLAGIAGLYLSYWAGTAAGASIAALLVGAYALAAAGRALGAARPASAPARIRA
jgi:ABC-type Mn2+/Zn2+ transport system permease subunit